MEGPHINAINYKTVLYALSPFFITKNICFFYIIFRFTYTPNIIPSFTFFSSTLESPILIISTRFLPESLFLLIKCISAYLLNKNFVLCFFTHAMHLLYAAISYLQLSAALPPQVIKLVLLINPNLSVLFLNF